MTEEHSDPVVVGLVRRYSDQLANNMPENALEKAVAVHETALQEAERMPTAWRRWLRFDVPESDSTVAILRAEAKETTELWESLRLDIGDLGIPGDQIPTVETLWTAVLQAQTQWDKKKEKGFGRAKVHLFSFLETMDEHKYLFSIIPNGDKYTSLITGVITSIVKASVNHESIAEGFSRALQEISRDLNFVRRGTRMCNTTEMKGHVILLYREVFAFLCHTMKWYSSSWNRFKKAFDNKFYDKNVESRVKRIQGLVQRVRDEMRLASDQMVQDIHLEQKTGFIETYNRIDMRLDEFEGVLDEKLMKFARMIGEQMCTTLMANAQHDLNDSRMRSLMGTVNDAVRGIARKSSNAAVTMTRKDLEWLKQSLGPFVEHGQESMPSDSMLTDIPLIPNDVAVDIQNWAQSQDSSLLWVEGPAYEAFGQALPTIGCRIRAISEDLSISCISFFAKTRYVFESQAISMKDAGIVSMIYSIISQLATIVPEIFDSVEDLVGDKLRRLDGTMQSIPTALETLKALLSVIEPGLVCVICGFELVDCRENLSILEEFIRILREQPIERRVKVLFLSHGNCRALSSMTNSMQRSDATRMVLSRGRSPLAGAVAAKDFNARVHREP
ncbi:uncharacterized protein GGS22DRAFT_189731 [Annulohypoxylon maeteangense]|uniref:uncharacterized protein n=1 Tax=Annulohypoxylon maeteangense TaxID=1927788 RepID=UPI0020075887|nr:uncharacterized protein GGS22DRAFT_189731 [Annulohypoxylon maeteangense]KAI0883763.1 hypothetical protein GGS22DRAFT_189731 [Annulohypoxylon maeteangense]